MTSKLKCIVSRDGDPEGGGSHAYEEIPFRRHGIQTTDRAVGVTTATGHRFPGSAATAAALLALELTGWPATVVFYLREKTCFDTYLVR